VNIKEKFYVCEAAAAAAMAQPNQSRFSVSHDKKERLKFTHQLFTSSASLGRALYAFFLCVWCVDENMSERASIDEIWPLFKQSGGGAKLAIR
jgi:hypothetical protein